MKCCSNAEPNPYPLRSEAGWCCGMCIRTPPEQRSTQKYFEAVHCYDDEHRNWAYFRFWRSTRTWPARASAVGDFYVAAARATLDTRLQRTNQRYAKRFYKRAAEQAPTVTNLHRLAGQYQVLAALAPTSKTAHAYHLKAHAARHKADPKNRQLAPGAPDAGPAASAPATLS